MYTPSPHPANNILLLLSLSAGSLFHVAVGPTVYILLVPPSLPSLIFYLPVSLPVLTCNAPPLISPPQESGLYIIMTWTLWVLMLAYVLCSNATSAVPKDRELRSFFQNLKTR